jgi:hypothetical protein
MNRSLASLTTLTLILMSALACVYADGAEFSLKYNEDSTLYGPFTLKEGGKMELDGRVFELKDLDKYGGDSFLVKKEDDGTVYGPFKLRNNGRVVIGKASFTMLVVDNAEKRQKREPVKAAKGKLDSDALIFFERLLDRVEIGLTPAIRSRSGDSITLASEYEKLLSQFKNAAYSLQSEVVKCGMNGDISLSKEALAMVMAYEDAKSQYRNIESCLPLVLSTRRNNRLPSGQPTTPSGLSGEDAFSEQNYSECRVMFNLDGYYSSFWDRFYQEMKRKKGIGSQNLNSRAYDFLQGVRRLRAHILTLDRSGNWNSIGRNGQVYYMRNTSDAGRAIAP